MHFNKIHNVYSHEGVIDWHNLMKFSMGTDTSCVMDATEFNETQSTHGEEVPRFSKSNFIM